jgi:hypothetical protein
MQSDKILNINVGKITRYLKYYKFSFLNKVTSAVAKSNPYLQDTSEKGKMKRTMWNEQCYINFPLLYICSIYLYIYAKERKCEKILFVTRDCCHWYKVFKAIFPDEECHYFHASRNMFEKATQDKTSEYHKYVDGIVDGDITKCVFVDIHGTGKRVFSYFETIYGKIPYYFLLSSTHASIDLFPDITYKYKNNCAVLTFNIRGSPIEMLNYDLVGTLQDFKNAEPVRDSLEYNYHLIKTYHTSMDFCIRQVVPLTVDTGRFKYRYSNLRKCIKKLIGPIINDKPIISKHIDHIGKHKNANGQPIIKI